MFLNQSVLSDIIFANIFIANDSFISVDKDIIYLRLGHLYMPCSCR